MERLDQIRRAVDSAQQTYDSGNPVAALRLLADVTFTGESLTDPLYARFLCVRGAAQAEAGQTELAAASFEEALEYHRSRNQESKMGLIHFNLGNVYKYSGRELDAEDNYRKAIDCFTDADEKQMLVLVQMALGNMVAASGNWNRSRECLAQANALLDDDQLHPSILWSKRSLQVKLAIVDGDEQMAVENGRQAVDAARRAGDLTYEAESLVFLAETLARRGETREARITALQARAVLKAGSGTQAEHYRRRVSAALMKINNLDFAFSAPVSAGKAFAAKVSPELAHTTRTTSTVGLDVPIMLAEGVSADKASFLSQLAATQGGTGLLCIFSTRDAWISLLSGREAVVLDILDPATWNRLEQEWAFSGNGAQALAKIAPLICQAGVDLKSTWQIEAALLHYAFALRVALRQRLIEGVEAITGNLLTLVKQIIANFKYRTEPLTGTGGEIKLTGGNVLVDPGGLGDKGPFDALLEFSRTEAANALTSLNEIREWAPTAQDPKLRLDVLRSLSRLRSLAGSRANDDWLVEICRLCESNGDTDVALESIYESLSDTDFLDMLAYLGKIASEEQGHLECAWELYLEWRSRIGATALPQAGVAASLAINHFEVLRATAVAGGRAFGHRISYDTTQFPTRISRDLIRMMIAGDRQQQLGALSLAERTCSRALVDWMGRTHTNNRLTIRKGITRSVGEVECASVAEVFSIAAQTRTTILHYAAVQDGFVRWDIHPDGTWDCALITELAGDLLKLFKALPYTFDAPDFAHAKANVLAAAGEKQREGLDQLLLDLGGKLLPERLRGEVERDSRERIAIVADQMLQFVPFSCLRLDATAYVADRFDVVYWPSATAWILCSQAEAFYEMEAQKSEDSIVVGGPDFSKPFSIFYRGVQREIELEDLPGARVEAVAVGNILGSAPLLGSAASFSTVLERYSAVARRAVPVLHLATHGLTDTWDPEQSFVAFADRLLTADFLYTFDAGMLTRLVMLSCCQTAVGYAHPDSILGLANAFLVVGACTVGSTLWNVEDDATSILMSCFYQGIKEGKDAASAMSTAQRHLRSIPLWSHPVYWAPFRISGSFSNPFSGGCAES